MWVPWSPMNHSDSAKKSFAKITFYAAKRVSKNDDFFAFSHFIPWCVFQKHDKVSDSASAG